MRYKHYLLEKEGNIPIINKHFLSRVHVHDFSDYFVFVVVCFSPFHHITYHNDSCVKNPKKTYKSTKSRVVLHLISAILKTTDSETNNIQ